MINLSQSQTLVVREMRRSIRIATMLAAAILVVQYAIFAANAHSIANTPSAESTQTTISNEWDFFEVVDSPFVAVSGLTTDRFRNVDGVFRSGFIPIESIQNTQFGFPLKWIETTTIGFAYNVKPFEDEKWKRSQLPRILPVEALIVSVLCFGVTFGLVMIVRWLMCSVRLRKGLCPRCGYQLSPEMKCSECGFGFASDH